MSEKHFIKNFKEERKCYIYVRKKGIWERTVKRTDILRKNVLKKKAIKRNSFYNMEEENRGNKEEGIIDPGFPDSVVGNI